MSFDTISARNILKYSKTSKYMIIDVRSYEVFAYGHIPGAVNMPYETLDGQMRRLSKTKIYIFYCERGSTSLLAARKFYRNGYNVLSLVGGYRAYLRECRENNV